MLLDNAFNVKTKRFVEYWVIIKIQPYCYINIDQNDGKMR